jgi:hypothetical protein
MARQRLRPEQPPLSKEDIKAGQQVFREWCGDNGVMVDPFAGADLCKKISIAIALTRESVGCPKEQEAK